MASMIDFSGLESWKNLFPDGMPAGMIPDMACPFAPG
jgi:hypothetical protein